MSLDNIADLYEVSSKATIVRSIPDSVLGNYEFLLLERDADFGGHFWDFPGGRLHHANDLYDALCREVSEELGQELRFNKDANCDLDIVAHEFWHGKGHPVIRLYQLIDLLLTTSSSLMNIIPSVGLLIKKSLGLEILLEPSLKSMPQKYSAKS